MSPMIPYMNQDEYQYMRLLKASGLSVLQEHQNCQTEEQL